MILIISYIRIIVTVCIYFKISAIEERCSIRNNVFFTGLVINYLEKFRGNYGADVFIRSVIFVTYRTVLLYTLSLYCF